MRGILRGAAALIILWSCTLCAQDREPLSLKQVLTAALSGNPGIEKARREIDAASARILQAGRIPNPELTLNWSETPVKGNFWDAGSREVGVTQQMEFPGKRSGRITIAEYDREMAALELEREILMVTAAATESFHRGLLAQKQVENLESVLELLQRFAEMTAIRYEAQKASFLEVLRARVEITKMKNQIVEARQTCRREIASLNRLMGKGGTGNVVLVGELTYRPFDPGGYSATDSIAKRKTSVRLAALQVERQNAVSSLAGKSYLPDFTLGLAYQRLREQPPFNANDFTGTTADAVGVSLTLSAPFWFWQGPRGETDEAAAQLRIAETGSVTAERDVRSAIELALADVLAAEEQVRAFDESLLRDVQDELEAGINSYRNEQIDALNLLEIYRTYTQTRAEYLRSLCNYRLALSRLDIAGE